MPYIKKNRRKALFNNSKTDYNSNMENAGELNYMITSLLLDYAEYKGASYQTYNDISGVLTEALAEFRRRVIVPYEEKKIKENGDLKGYK